MEGLAPGGQCSMNAISLFRIVVVDQNRAYDGVGRKLAGETVIYGSPLIYRIADQSTTEWGYNICQ